MDPKKELVQNLMGKIDTGFMQVTSRSHSQTLFEIFSPNESRDKEDHDHKRARSGWKQRTKADYETCMFCIDHRVNMNCHDPMHLDDKEYRQNYRLQDVMVRSGEDNPTFQNGRLTGSECHDDKWKNLVRSRLKYWGHCTDWEKDVHSTQFTTLLTVF